MQLTLHRTLLIHTLLPVGIGGYWVAHRRVPDKTAPVKHVRMPTQAEQMEIIRLSGETGLTGSHDSEASQKRCLALIDLQLRYMPPEHPEVVNNRKVLARSFNSSHRYAEAAEQYRALLKAFQRVMGPEAPETLECQTNLKSMLDHLSESEKRLQECRDSYQAQSLALGKEHPQVLRLQTELAERLLEMSKYEEAERELRFLVNVQRKMQKDIDDTANQNLLNLAVCLKEKGQRKEALEIVEEVEWIVADFPRADALVFGAGGRPACRNQRRTDQAPREAEGAC